MKNALKRAHYLPGLTWRPAEQTTASGGEAEAFRLSVPRFRFDPPERWESVGTSTWLATGTNLEDKRSVIAKVAAARSAAGMVLERELLLISKLAGSLESSERALRLIDFFIIPPEQGDVVVLIVQHPGANSLPAFYPSLYSQSFLCPAMLSAGGDGRSIDDDSVGGMAPRSVSRSVGDDTTPTPETAEWPTYEGTTPLTSPAGEVAPDDEVRDLTEMDLATFLEFAIQATQCVESLHARGATHLDIRPSAFHFNVQTGSVRFAHMGHRSVPLDELNSEKWRVESMLVREAVAYVAPEQTGLSSFGVDQRTDLYGLGATFLALLTGQIPWSHCTEVLHSIVSRKPRRVTELRPDVPPVLAAIIDRLLAKNPDDRYRTASGLGWDLIQAQLKLTDGRGHDASSNAELLPSFLLGTRDRFSTFIIPSAVYGREKELETIRGVLSRVVNTHALQYQPRRPALATPTSSSVDGLSSIAPGLPQSFGQQTQVDLVSDGGSSSRASRAGSVSLSAEGVGPLLEDSLATSSTRSLRTSSFASSSCPPGRGAYARKGGRERSMAARTVVISGPAGSGKSALIVECQRDFRKAGFFGVAKFETGSAAPYATILGTLSAIFRQLLDSRADLHRFWQASKDKLGPCLRNVQLLHAAIPELKEITTLFGLSTRPSDIEKLATAEQTRARFLALVIDVFAVLAQQKPITIALDDLHLADEASLSLLRSLGAAKLRMLIVITVRTESLSVAHETFGQGSRSTYIALPSLTPEAVGAFVSDALHDTRTHVAPLSDVLHKAAHGNVLLVRELLSSLKRANHIFYDFQSDAWRFNLHTIETQFLPELARKDAEALCDIGFLLAHLQQLPKAVRRFLGWASLFGSTFRQQDVCGLMDAEESSGSDASSGDETPDLAQLSRLSMAASQTAISEGWITAQGRGFYRFSHDRYRHAAVSLLADTPETEREGMMLKIVDILLSYPDASRFQAASLLLKCMPLLLRSAPVDLIYTETLFAAGQEALTQGATESAYSLLAASEQLGAVSGAWQTERSEMFELELTLVGLELYSNRREAATARIIELYEKADTPVLRARIMFKDARLKFVEQDHDSHFHLLVQALSGLGVEVALDATDEDRDLAYAGVKSMLSLQGDSVGDLKPVTDESTLLASDLLAEATIAAFWTQGGRTDIFALRLVELVLTKGMTPSACLGFVWLGFVASSTFGDLSFGSQMTHFAADLAQHPLSSGAAKGRTLTLSIALGAYASPLKEARQTVQAATRFSLSAGDLSFASFGRLHELGAALLESMPLAEGVPLADDVLVDIRRWQPDTAAETMAYGTANTIKALAGETVNVTPLTILDTDDFVEERDLPQEDEASGVTLYWYYAFKIVALHALGWTEEAVALGFYLWPHRSYAEGHHHARRAAYVHSLALVAQLRRGDLPTDVRERYRAQITLNQEYVDEWAGHAPESYEHWSLLVQAEVAALDGLPTAFGLYDMATNRAEEGAWTSDLGWCYFFAGSHLARVGAVHLGTELQQRGVETHASWGASAVADYMSLQFRHAGPRRHSRVDAAVQTDFGSPDDQAVDSDDEDAADTATLAGEMSEGLKDYKDLSLADFQTIIRGSLTIGADVNVASSLESLTNLVQDCTHAQDAAIILRNDDGQHIIATSVSPTQAVTVHESPPLLVDAEDPALLAIATHVIASHEKLLLGDASRDPRFSHVATETRAVICLPISLRGRSIGAIYVTSRRAHEFTPAKLAVLAVLASQACIALGNSLLFRNLQAASRANIKGIAAQSKSLAEARAAREEAVNLSRVKSTFLATMSHELRTPLSACFGLLGLLAETALDQEQQDFVQTARSSCELLLDIIDSLLDYSKLEAGQLKLFHSSAPTEDAAADCLELLTPLAVGKGLELSYNISPEVPLVLNSDASRVRQILMNLLGNSIKFCESGSVRLTITPSPPGTLDLKDGEIAIRAEVTDTGIGMTTDEQKKLFTPFHQTDGSTTRRFGGTGLGLSICLQLVKLFNGKIGLRSEPAVGSTFWFDIPCRLDPAQNAKAAKATRKLLRQINTPTPLSILVFSTSPTTTASVVDAFAGSRVATVDSVPAFIERLQAADQPYELYVIDGQTSEALDALKARSDPSKRLPNVIRLLAPSVESLKARTEALEGVSVLYHPLRRRRLLDMAVQLASRLQRTSSTDERVKAMTTSAAPVRTIDFFTEAEKEILARTSVLIAEDNEIAARLLVKTLERVHIKVTATTRGGEAVNEWAAQPEGHFALALFDHHMPGVNNSGPSAAARIRVLESRKGHSLRLPIVGLSADVQTTARALCISSGMDDYLSKPLKQQDLINLVRLYIFPIDQLRRSSTTSTDSTDTASSIASSPSIATVTNPLSTDGSRRGSDGLPLDHPAPGGSRAFNESKVTFTSTLLSAKASGTTSVDPTIVSPSSELPPDV